MILPRMTLSDVRILQCITQRVARVKERQGE